MRARSLSIHIALWLVLFTAAAGILSPLSAVAVSLDSRRDCGKSAIIRCGALSTEELIDKYTGNTELAHIYDYFGISPADVMMMETTAASGAVTSSGELTVGGQAVATQAVFAQRTKRAGSLQIVHKGADFYARPASLGGRQDSIPAFVVLKDGRFDFAILASGANPVKAQAASLSGETEPQSVQPGQEVNTSGSSPQVASASTSASLPDTGPGSLLLIFTAAIFVGTFSHLAFTRLRQQK